MVFTEYGPYWRNIRKFCTLELLSATKIDSFARMRREEVVLFVENIKEAAAAGQVVDVSEKVGGLIEDMMVRMLFGHSIRDDRFDLKCNIQEITDAAGAFNIADFLPILAPLDLQGLTRRFKALHKDLDKTLEMIVNEHEEAATSGRKKLDLDFVDVLLSLLDNSSENNYAELSHMLDRRTLKGIIVDMIAAGIDTSHTAIEWIMTELIRHPRIMKQLQEEIKSVVGVNENIEETDLTKFKYLDMVIKETFRLHPVVPLLVPRESMGDIVIDGYYIPKKSRVLINSWTLGRDPDLWSENVEEFIPERFVSGVDFFGHDYEFLPFGSGRRICPGMHLGLINIRQIVAQLVHCFDWELPNGMSLGDLNMDEKFGITLPRAQHLLAMPVRRL